MQQVFNASPVQIKAMAEGQSYWFDPGEIKDIREEHRVATLIHNFGAKGLREIKHGDDLETIQEEAKAALCVHMLDSIQQVKQYQLDQASQGLKLLRDSSDVIRQHKEYARLYKELTGEELHVAAGAGEDGDAQLGVIKGLARVTKDLGDSPMAERAKALLADLVKAEKDKDLDMSGPAHKTGPVAAVKNRARGGRR
jgi:hypothetical protein